MIALESLDCSGKSTQVETVSARIKESGCKIGALRYTALRQYVIGGLIQTLYKSSRSKPWV